MSNGLLNKGLRHPRNPGAVSQDDRMFVVKGKIRTMRTISKDKGDVFMDTLYRRLTCIFLSQGELILFCVQ